MTTIILGICDTHWSDRRPRSRKDPDYLATQRNKLRKLLDLAERITLPNVKEKGAAAIVHAGDLFHQPKGPIISRKLDGWLSQELRRSPCPWLVIPGNHDMQSHRLESLENHPYGTLLANDLVKQVIWPTYVAVGTDPVVLVTGKEFIPEGPISWLSELSTKQELIKLKNLLSEGGTKKVQSLALLHGWFGAVDSTNRGEPVTGFDRFKETGIDSCIYGHPHQLDGVNTVQDQFGQIQIVGPGALIRGTIAEIDTHREPKIAIMIYHSDGHREIKLVSVPHEPAEKVFDFETYKKEQNRTKEESLFMDECRAIDSNNKSLEEIMIEAEKSGTSARIITRAKQYLTQAEKR